MLSQQVRMTHALSQGCWHATKLQNSKAQFHTLLPTKLLISVTVKNWKLLVTRIDNNRCINLGSMNPSQ